MVLLFKNVTHYSKTKCDMVYMWDSVFSTLRFCTSSDIQRDNWSCYRRKSLANTLLQNYNIIVPFHSKFYYPMNLHYSKTLHRLLKQLLEFYYPMNLHYSKTRILSANQKKSFYYPMNLHYSKTSKEVSEAATSVCITGH